MNRFCTNCGIKLEQGMKVCPNCGRLLSSIGDKHEYQPRQRSASGKAPQTQKPRPAQSSHRQQRAQQEPPVREKASSKGRAIKNLIIIALLLTVIYLTVFWLQVFRIRHTGYEFDTPMALTADTFGEAIDQSFQEGSWSYNPFTFTASYKGQHGSEEIELTFSALVDVKVKSLIVDGEEKAEGKQTDNYLLGLFI
ncbi:MAG: zinc ribbon domain-containing protein [Ruminococcus sp.]|nr:zinc ribbon domain-containing protein [Ruminococcus sp.]